MTGECKGCRVPIDIGALCDDCVNKAMLRCAQIEATGAEFVEYLKRSIRESIQLARREGVQLEEFLRVQLSSCPPHINERARVVMIGHTVLLWFEK